MQKDKALGALGLCRRAGRLVQGFDRVLETALRGRAQLVVLASDASERTARKVREGCEGLCPVRTVPLTQAELAGLFRRPAAVLAVTDENLARLCESSLAGLGEGPSLQEPDPPEPAPDGG